MDKLRLHTDVDLLAANAQHCRGRHDSSGVVLLFLLLVLSLPLLVLVVAEFTIVPICASAAWVKAATLASARLMRL